MADERSVLGDIGRGSRPVSAAAGCLLGLIVLASSAAHGQPAPPEPVAPEIVTAYKYGHQKDCVASSGRQLRAGEISLGDTQLEAYCSCLGSAYFDDLTVEQHEMMRKTGWKELPPGLAARSEEIQSRCFDTAAIPGGQSVNKSMGTSKRKSKGKSKGISQ